MLHDNRYLDGIFGRRLFYHREQRYGWLHLSNSAREKKLLIKGNNYILYSTDTHRFRINARFL